MFILFFINLSRMFMKKSCITEEMYDAMKLNANLKNKPLN